MYKQEESLSLQNKETRAGYSLQSKETVRGQELFSSQDILATSPQVPLTFGFGGG
jgi:hypothetical protein